MLDSRLKTSLPVSTAGYVPGPVGVAQLDVCVCVCVRLDLSGLLQGRLQSLSTASADTEAKRPSCMVRGWSCVMIV